MRVARSETFHITPTEADAIARVRALLEQIEDNTEWASTSVICSVINYLFDQLMEKVEVDG